jgi:hypothetical protein
MMGEERGPNPEKNLQVRVREAGGEKLIPSFRNNKFDISLQGR